MPARRLEEDRTATHGGIAAGERTDRKPSGKRKSPADERKARPFVKWAGGKRGLLDQIRPHLPERFGRYHEPFVGSGALYFDICPRRASLSDTNERLVRCYRGLRDEPLEVIRLLKSYPHERAFFLELRERDIDAASDVEVAAWFIYLNRTGYNGLYRVNRKNRFNVPFGRYVRPTICDEENLLACSRLLAGARIEVSDFETAARRARRGDLVYFDPPYDPLSRTSSFTSYTSDKFGDGDHERLRDLALELTRRGVHVILSNSATPRIRQLYGDAFDLIEVYARRSINSAGDKRKPIPELLILGRS